MLYKFLNEHRVEILSRSRDQIAASVVPTPTTEELSEGVPVFLAQLADILGREEGAAAKSEKSIKSAETAIGVSGAHHGRQLLTLGFTMSQVVHGYGALCQVVTGLLDELGVVVAAREYQTFNRCFDNVIAEAVTAYETESDARSDRREVEHLGSLAHELRNALNTAMAVSELIATGQVGFDSRTASLLGRAHARMRDLIDRSLVEVRLRAGLEPRYERIHLAGLFDEIATTARGDAKRRGIELQLTVDPALFLQADHQLLTSAIANLVQNALKYSHPQSQVQLRAQAVEDLVIIEVEDACGGIPEEKLDRIFEPYVQASEDRSGIGLGLPIVLRAARAQGGQVHVSNLPGKGCIFRIELPRAGKS